jgi:putative nucleotidyltransferase with HDIG domain
MEANIAVNNMPGVLGERRNLSQWVPVYTGGIAALGLAIVILALTDLPEDLLGLFFFAAMAAVAQFFDVELFTSSRSRVSVSSIIDIASILVFGPLAGALTTMASGVMTAVTTTLRSEQPGKRRASWLQRSAFNVGMFVTAAAAGGWMYVWLGGTIGTVGLLSNVLPLIGAVTADTVLNAIILIGVIALQTERHALDIWKQDLQWSAPITILGGVIGGGALALAYEMFHTLGLAVFLFPVLATGYAFRVYVANTKGYVNKLEEVNRSLDEANLGLLETLGAVIDAYDIYTYGHSTQVAVYARAIAEKMNLSSEEQSVVVKAALVHDVGKIGVMDTIFSKEGPLTDDECNFVRRHPIIGAEILGRTKGLQELVPVVRHHHERWDGGGYPDGLEGEEIPLGARILALADALDALCSDRPYRRTRSLKEVMEEIIECSGTQFDPNVVKAFFAVEEERDRDFFKNSAVTVDKVLQKNGVASVSKDLRYMKKSMMPETIGWLVPDQRTILVSVKD